MSGGMENITVADCDFTKTASGLNIKYSAFRGGYVKDIHYKNIIMGDQARAALTVNGYYGSKNPSCKSENKPVPCPVSQISYTNITQAPGTSVAGLIDFEGLPSNAIEGISIDGVHLDGKKAVKCSRVEGTYKACPECAKCEGLKPAQ